MEANSIQFIHTFIEIYIICSNIIKSKRKREINNFIGSVRGSEELSFQANHRIYNEWKYIRCGLGAMATMGDHVKQFLCIVNFGS